MSKINETNYPRRTQANYADTDMLVLQAAGGNTYTTRLEDMREDYEETLAPALSELQDDVNENLATIEAGSTASKAYAKGDFLVFGGKLCKAKTAIAVNATLVLDTNIELDSVGDELTSLSSQFTSLVSKLNVLDIKTSNGGAFSQLLSNTGEVWLIIGQRLATSEAIVLVAHYYGTVYVTPIFQSQNMSYETNNLGTINLKYYNSGTNVYSCAMRLY